MTARPRAFDPSRVRRALRTNLRTLLGVTALALFGGALVGRLAVPNLQVASAAARIVRDPHLVVAQALDDAVLERAIAASKESISPAALRAATRVRFSGADALEVQVSVPGSGSEAQAASARKLADALVETYVGLANARVDGAHADGQRQQGSELQLARAEHERAQTALAVAQAREGVPALAAQLGELRAAIGQLESAAQTASVDAQEDHERALALRQLGPARPGRQAARELAVAQRELSRALAQGGDDARVGALRARIARLQQQRVAPHDGAIERHVEARAQGARARELTLQLTRKRTELARLQEVAARVAPLAALADRAQQRLDSLRQEARVVGGPSTAPRHAARSQVVSRAALVHVERRGLRLLVSLLAPAIALLALALFYGLRELRGLRVCAPTELAHWLAVPVLTSSSWPRLPDALEALVDELADPAIDALGTTLLLPLSELERPLAATLAAQLNARAQRHYRSPTGSRVTIAQDWQGELDSSRIRRAAEVADRVLWVVAADSHQGEVLLARRGLVGRTEHVAALLVDAESGVDKRVGDSAQFWVTQPARLAEASFAPERVPVH